MGDETLTRYVVTLADHKGRRRSWLYLEAASPEEACEAGLRLLDSKWGDRTQLALGLLKISCAEVNGRDQPFGEPWFMPPVWTGEVWGRD